MSESKVRRSLAETQRDLRRSVWFLSQRAEKAEWDEIGRLAEGLVRLAVRRALLLDLTRRRSPVRRSTGQR